VTKLRNSNTIRTYFSIMSILCDSTLLNTKHTEINMYVPIQYIHTKTNLTKTGQVGWSNNNVN
jgi:hypothetical protein